MILKVEVPSEMSSAIDIGTEKENVSPLSIAWGYENSDIGIFTPEELFEITISWLIVLNSNDWLIISMEMNDCRSLII